MLYKDDYFMAHYLVTIMNIPVCPTSYVHAHFFHTIIWNRYNFTRWNEVCLEIEKYYQMLEVN